MWQQIYERAQQYGEGLITWDEFRNHVVVALVDENFTQQDANKLSIAIENEGGE